jgi:hypothetical protein
MKEFQAKLRDPVVTEQISKKRQEALELLNNDTLSILGAKVFGKPSVSEVNRLDRAMDKQTLARYAVQAVGYIKHNTRPKHRSHFPTHEIPADNLPYSTKEFVAIVRDIEAAVQDF